jgi:hypothetical protein
MKGTHKPHMSYQKVIFIKLCLIALLCALFVGVFVLWAKSDGDSIFAKNVRALIGLTGPAIPESTIEPAAAPVIEVALPKPLEPEPVKPSKPLPVEFNYKEFVDSPGMWPDVLELMFETSVPIIYNGKHLGQMRFVPGQVIKVDSIHHNQKIIGSVDGNYLSIPAAKTSLLQTFHDEYGEQYYMRLPEGFAESSNEDEEAKFQVDLLYAMRKWCDLHYGNCSFEIADEALILRWLAQEDAPVNFLVEGRAVARQYLKLVAERGGTDNYAACEIYHPRTGKLLGIGSFFTPSFSALGFSQREK